MKTKFFSLIVLVLLFSQNLFGVAYKGQRIYAKNCVSCHGKQPFIQSKKASEWEAVIGKNGEKLAKIHTKSPKAKESLKFFQNKKYKRKVRHLKDFLTEYAKDGKVPTCN